MERRRPPAGQRPPAGPRGVTGAAAEDAAAGYLRSQGWSIIGRNVRVGRDELDIVAIEPGQAACLVIVEVRSGSTGRFGSPRESVDARKVARIYRAGLALRRQAYPGLSLTLYRPVWRVDLVTLVHHGGVWRLEAHVRGLEPP
jgi:putative endonuclease